MSSEAPVGWKCGRISDLVEEVTARIDPQAVTDPDTPYLGLEDIGQGTGTIVSVGRAGSATSQKSGFIAGDILFGKLRPNLKKVARPNFDGICSTDIVVFRSKSQADPDFAFRALSSEPVIEHAVAQSAGTKMPRAHARSVLNFETILPPLDEQRRIAEVLRSVDDLLSLVEQEIRQSKSALAAYLAEAFANAVPVDGSGSPLEDLLSHIIDYRGVPPPKAAAGIPLLTAKNVRFGYLDPEPREFVAEDDYDAWMRRGLPALGDVMLTTEAPLGNVAEFPNYRAALGQRTLTLRSKPDRLTPTYLKWLLLSPTAQALIHRHATGSTAKGIKQSTFRKLRFHVPQREEQAEVGAACDAIWAVVLGARNQRDSLRRLRTMLSGDLLSGRVRTPA